MIKRFIKWWNADSQYMSIHTYSTNGQYLVFVRVVATAWTLILTVAIKNL